MRARAPAWCVDCNAVQGMADTCCDCGSTRLAALEPSKMTCQQLSAYSQHCMLKNTQHRELVDLAERIYMAATAHRGDASIRDCYEDARTLLEARREERP